MKIAMKFKGFLTDTAANISFYTPIWLVVYAVLGLDLERIAVFGAIGGLMNLGLGGVYGRWLDWVRKCSSISKSPPAKKLRATSKLDKCSGFETRPVG